MNPIAANPALAGRLERLHDESEAQILASARAAYGGDDESFRVLAARYAELAPERKGAFLKEHGIAVQEAGLSLAVSPEMGAFLFNLVLAKGARSVLELGSSNGVSTLYFAEALRRTGGGRVVATELEAAKCDALAANAAEVGLGDYIELHRGDVFETVDALEGPFDILFIDIWASGYLDIFKAAERLLRPGTVVLADNMFTAADEVAPFKAHLEAHAGVSSTTLPFEAGVEFAVVL